MTCRYSKKDDVKNYYIYGVAIAEVEVDMLTGDRQVNVAEQRAKYTRRQKDLDP